MYAVLPGLPSTCPYISTIVKRVALVSTCRESREEELHSSAAKSLLPCLNPTLLAPNIDLAHELGHLETLRSERARLRFSDITRRAAWLRKCTSTRTRYSLQGSSNTSRLQMTTE
eukprot:450075-Pleurochrysis_carterae.AAC.3